MHDNTACCVNQSAGDLIHCSVNACFDKNKLLFRDILAVNLFKHAVDLIVSILFGSVEIYLRR